MDINCIKAIELTNPWLSDPSKPILVLANYQERLQTKKLLLPEWDSLWTILTGPRRAGKTTLGKHLCEILRRERFSEVLYLNCDYHEIRTALRSPLALVDFIYYFKLNKPIIFIDEVQRIENPGLVLKAIADLQLPIKMLASGSSQLEIKSKVQEHLTGRQFSSLILPLSLQEQKSANWEECAIYGCYPQIIMGTEKQLMIEQLYQDYIAKDIVEFLQVKKPDSLQMLLSLVAHSSGQLVNYNQLANDCQLNHATVKNHLHILEETYVIHAITPFSGNKRTEVTSNPVFYFIDNGFRNYALHNFTSLTQRTDNGLLVESFIFQEIYKFKAQYFLSFDMHYWRTKSGAEVDFVLTQGLDVIIPIEVKFQNFSEPKITRSLRSFIDTYQPRQAFIINKNYFHTELVDNCLVQFIPLDLLTRFFTMLMEMVSPP